MTSEQARAARVPDGTIDWSYYTLTLDEVCRDAAIHVPPNSEIEADFPERGLMRITVKAITGTVKP